MCVCVLQVKSGRRQGERVVEEGLERRVSAAASDARRGAGKVLLTRAPRADGGQGLKLPEAGQKCT